MFEMRAKMITVGLLGAAAMLPIDLAKADQLGHASWYSLPANITANGERMDPNELTAAHRSLPFGTRVLVENLTNGRPVVVRINDRGPFIGGRIIDLSKAAAASIGMINAGTAKVRVTTATAATRLPLWAKPLPRPRTGLFDGQGQGPDGFGRNAAQGDRGAKSSKGKRVAAKASSRLTHIAKKQLTLRPSCAVASASKRNHVPRAPARMSAWPPTTSASYNRGVHAAAAQASRLQTRRVIVVASVHPYAFLGTTPGFMKPDRVPGPPRRLIRRSVDHRAPGQAHRLSLAEAGPKPRSSAAFVPHKNKRRA